MTRMLFSQSSEQTSNILKMPLRKGVCVCVCEGEAVAIFE